MVRNTDSNKRTEIETCIPPVDRLIMAASCQQSESESAMAAAMFELIKEPTQNRQEDLFRAKKKFEDACVISSWLATTVLDDYKQLRSK